jgi:hypothetical protein
MSFRSSNPLGEQTMYNVNKTHPLIPNSQNYTSYKKYVSIHSEDRDFIKYPSSSSFEIELPEDYLNVSTVRLVDWTFPANYSTFSPLTSNITMTFLINNPYNPGEHEFSDALQEAIFTALYNNKNNNYRIIIEEGFYNPDQMSTELTNKFNDAVNTVIKNYFTDNISIPGYAELLAQFISSGGYNQFVIVYNTVGQKLWFGNKSSGFILTNSTSIINDYLSSKCDLPKLPDFSSWGLPGYLGLDRCDIESTSIIDFVPRFYYGDVFPGDNGYWLLPDLPTAQVSFISATYKINLFGVSYIYMEIDGLNSIDETSPYNVSNFTITTNKTNGIVNSAFAKLAVPTTPMSQWFDREALPYKLYLPPAERIRKLKIKLRYHNGQQVNFGVFNYAFTLEFMLYSSQQLREYRLFQPGTGGTNPNV